MNLLKIDGSRAQHGEIAQDFIRTKIPIQGINIAKWNTKNVSHIFKCCKYCTIKGIKMVSKQAHTQK